MRSMAIPARRWSFVVLSLAPAGLPVASHAANAFRRANCSAQLRGKRGAVSAHCRRREEGNGMRFF